MEEDFPWYHRILGEYRTNATYIQQETGVLVWLSGKLVDDTDGPLTLTLTGGFMVSDDDFNRAVGMCEDLLEHVYTEAAGWAGADDDEPEKGQANAEIQRQLADQGGAGSVWIEGWPTLYRRRLGTLRQFLERQPSLYRVVPLGHTKFYVVLV